MLQNPKETGGIVKLGELGEFPFDDAKKSLVIEVTQEDISKGKCSSPGACVMARAINRNLGSLFQHVVVGKTVIHIVMNGRSVRFGVKGKMGRAIHHFDKFGVWLLEPGKLTLFPPSKSQKRGGRPNRHGLYGGKGGKAQGRSTILAAPTRLISHLKREELL